MFCFTCLGFAVLFCFILSVFFFFLMSYDIQTLVLSMYFDSWRSKQFRTLSPRNLSKIRHRARSIVHVSNYRSMSPTKTMTVRPVLERVTLTRHRRLYKARVWKFHWKRSREKCRPSRRRPATVFLCVGNHMLPTVWIGRSASSATGRNTYEANKTTNVRVDETLVYDANTYVLRRFEAHARLRRVKSFTPRSERFFLNLFYAIVFFFYIINGITSACGPNDFRKNHRIARSRLLFATHFPRTEKTVFLIALQCSFVNNGGLGPERKNNE